MRGIYTALVTPFTEDGGIDWDGLDRLIAQQVAQKVDGLVICGTTAESPTLTREEKLRLLSHVLERTAGLELDLVAGTGSNCTRETVEFTQQVEQLGYQRFLVVTPYYNKPSQKGLVAHFTAIANAIRGEVVLYNVPGRTGISLSSRAIAALAAHPRITALKEATGNLEFLREIREALRESGHSLDLLSGDDPTFLPFLRGGGVGSISVASHLIGGTLKQIQHAHDAKEDHRAEKLHERALRLCQHLFIDTNPGPVKFCLAEAGLIQEVLRLPLVPISDEHRSVLRHDLSEWTWKDGALQ